MEEFNNTPFNEEMSERVDRFLRKEMSDAESSAFINELKTNPELKECYQRQFNLMRSIKFKQMSEIMKAKEKELSYVKPKPDTTTVPFFTRYKYVLSTVAVAAAMVCGVFIWDGSVTRSVGTQELTSVVWKGYDSIDELIKQEKYEEAIIEIDKELNYEYNLGDDPDALAAHEEDMNELRFKKALVYLAMGKKHKAKQILKQLDNTQSKEVLDKLLW